ncbi:hypothetical protein FE257_007893 [Aspergillus nanangensis]|uniref:Uncharacterized protein n=1 Tax=Aspergillus nanangensis TaxID=2582783 RepID=A0AAD4CX66_ASPNN|nr:hypothetical protein FE257_007893 [Aspergillus nanangensis]
MTITNNNNNNPRATVLITGCSAGGIGSALVEDFHARGLHVFATARSLAKMAHLESLPHVTLLELDVESSTSIAAAVETITSKTGAKLDYLVNNSGINLNYPALDTDLEYARRMFEVNFWGAVNVVQAFAPLMVARGSGTIVNNASLAGAMHTPWGSFYGASKAAVKMYGECLRLEMAPLGVKVVTVMTGIVGSKIFENSPHEALPETSYYKVAEKEIAELAAGKLKESSMSAETYARNVVGDILGGANGVTWRGRISSIGWFLSSFVPTWLTDRALVTGSGLDRM